MAQMVIGPSAQKRQTPLVDLTPMVDLAFLLIAFFMLTTSLQKNNAMILHMPMDTNDPVVINPARTLTLLVDANNKVRYYNADLLENLETTNYQNTGLRKIVYENKLRVAKIYGEQKGLICLIKLADGANYKNMVDVLDEMEICAIATYAIQDMSAKENEALFELNK